MVFGTSYILGDLDFDGDVDFNDFTLFAQNFGKTGGAVGQPTLTDTTIVTIVVQEIREPVSGEIPNLAFITVLSDWSNWDADTEKDGIVITIFPNDIAGNSIPFSEMPINLAVRADVALYKDNDGNNILDGEAIYRGRFQGTTVNFFGIALPLIRIPKEQIKVDLLKDQKEGVLEVSLTTPNQGTFSAADDWVELYQGQ